MSSLKLPQRFADKLKGQRLESATLAALETASLLIGDPTGGLPFFPEYTDHALTHFQRVLGASASILNDEAHDILTPEDVYVICNAVILHDIAMHLREDGFVKIVTKAWNATTDWSTLWVDFKGEAARWGAKELIDVLGNTDDEKSPNDLAILAQMPIPLDCPDDWTRRQRKLIGEFIRRHHATLAQEFAQFGFPGAEDPIRIIPENCKYAFLSGLIARSHHLNLRDTFSTLQERYRTRTTCLDTHPVLLMAALRIADYLDLKSERAPAMSLSLHAIRNPVSKGEWNAHQAIEDIREDEHDPEALFVLAQLGNIGTYLRLRDLFDDFQRELDMSWAVLGEVFGRRNSLKSAGLSIRRLVTNFDDDLAFRKTISYIPKKFLFRTAGAKFLNNLVAPLYDEGGFNSQVQQ